MTTLREFEDLLRKLSSRGEGPDPEVGSSRSGGCFPGIESRPDVCGGEACIVRTRIPVWLLEQARRLRVSEQALLAAYPVLRAEDLVNARHYARGHAAEIEAQIRENEAA